MHPLDDLLDNGFVFFPLLCLGVPPWLVLLAGPLLLLHTIYLHARVEVPLGPLSLVLATPAFHRAHHAAAGPVGNFGGVLSLWDHLFGTARSPSLDVPTGLPASAALPETLVGQLVEPLRRALRR
jgi:sterol desaturase/sphingolipid hydroxylase (fatty acid hydroxylase superfamily)